MYLTVQKLSDLLSRTEVSTDGLGLEDKKRPNKHQCIILKFMTELCVQSIFHY